MKKLLSNAFSVALILSLLLSGVASAAPAWFLTPSATVFINEIHYDNTGTDTGEAVEVAGPAGTDLTGWSIVLYNGADGKAYNTSALSGAIPDQGNGFGTVVVNYPSNGIQNGAPDGLALVNNGSVVMFLSYEGAFTAVGGPADGMLSTDIGVVEAGADPVGYSLQLTGTGTTYDNFSWAADAPSTFGAFNTGQSFGAVINAPVTVTCGPAISLLEGGSATRNITASDPDGMVISLTAVVDPASTGISLSAATPADAVGGTASAALTIDSTVVRGDYTVTITAANNDATPQTSTCTLTVSVVPILTVGEVQGPVSDSDDGLTSRSPYAPKSGNGTGQTVYVRGVITEKMISMSGSTANNGFFLESTPSFSDNDPLTSDGIFVFIGRFTTLRKDGGGAYTPKVGDEVLLKGPVVEYYNLTQLSNPYVVQVLRSGVDLAAETPAFDVNPPSNIQDANRYWERHEGMLAQVPAGSIAIDGRDLFASTMDAEVWLARGDSAIAQAVDPYARRAFRDPHPLDDDPALFDNGNGYRFLLGSMGLKATYNDPNAILAPVRTFDTITNAPLGAVYFSFSKYQIMVEDQLAVANGVDPALNAPPQIDPQREYSVVTYNLENLYDYRDDPNDGCDFTGNSGCPGVKPPFDYVPASQGDYNKRISDIATQIVNDLHSPDLMLVQEVEDQDICSLTNGAVTCGTADNADGQPDALEDLAVKIAALGGPAYRSAFDRNGADDRGIVSAFLFRADQVELLPVNANHPVLGNKPQINYRSTALSYNSDVSNPKAFNAVLPSDVDKSTGVDGSNVFTRAPQVGWFRIWRDGIGASVFTDLYAISNHFSSTPDGRVGQRTEQAAYNAAIIAALQASDPNVYVTTGGDLNVYPRPDDPFTPGSKLYPSDQLGPLYHQGLTNLWDVLVQRTPSSAYSYVYQGQTQTLDQMFVTPPMLGELSGMFAAHINSDWPADYPEDVARGTSDHDPQFATYQLLPSIDRLEALVYYFANAGQVSNKNTVKLLIDRLERARAFYASGQMDAYRDQLVAFTTQITDLSPFISASASAALIKEANLLLTLP